MLQKQPYWNIRIRIVKIKLERELLTCLSALEDSRPCIELSATNTCLNSVERYRRIGGFPLVPGEEVEAAALNIDKNISCDEILKSKVIFGHCVCANLGVNVQSQCAYFSLNACSICANL